MLGTTIKIVTPQKAKLINTYKNTKHKLPASYDPSVLVSNAYLKAFIFKSLKRMCSRVGEKQGKTTRHLIRLLDFPFRDKRLQHKICSVQCSQCPLVWYVLDTTLSAISVSAVHNNSQFASISTNSVAIFILHFVFNSDGKTQARIYHFFPPVFISILTPSPSMPRQPQWVQASSLLRFGDHTHTTLGRTPLYEWSDRRRHLYLTTHNTHNRT
jgi:hypothetical protein